MMAVTMLVGMTIWSVADQIQTRQIRQLFQTDLLEKLERQAREDRIRFDNRVESYHHAVKLLSSQMQFRRAVARMPQDLETVTIVRNRDVPSWLPDASILRHLVPIQHAILLDGRGRVREIYENDADRISPSLLSLSTLLLRLSHNQSFTTLIDGEPTLLAAETVRDRQDRKAATLLLVAHLNDDFLVQAHQSYEDETIIALIGGEPARVVATSRPDLIGKGERLDELTERYLVTTKSFFDRGGSDLVIQYTALISRAEIDRLSQVILRDERIQRGLTASFLIVAFALIILYITRNIQKVTREVVNLSKDELGIGPRDIPRGDQFRVLIGFFRRFADEVVRAREAKYRRLYESMTDAFVSVDMNGGILDCNRAYMEMLGYAKSELMQMTYLDLTPEKWREAEERIVREEVFTKGHSEVYEKEYIRKGGSVFPVELRAFLLHGRDGQPAGLWAIVRDISERRRSAEALKRSYDEAERFRLMVEYSQQAIGTASLDSIFTYGNSALLRMLDVLSLDEFRTHSFKDFYTNEDLDFVMETVIPAVLEQGKWTGEVPLRSLSGRIVPTIHSLYLIKDGQGNPVSFSNVITDISERKRAEEDLRNAKQFSEGLIKTANVIVVVLNQRGEVVQLNEAGEKITGYRQNELVGRSWFEMLVPRDRYPEMWDAFRRLTETKAFVSTITSPILTKGGVEHVVSWQNSTLATDQGLVTVSFGIDITEKRLAEERYRNILQTAIDGYWLADGSGRLLEVNDAYCRMSGYGREELLQMRIQDLEAAEQPEETARHIEKVISQGADRFDSLHRRKDGTVIHVEVSAQHLQEQGGMFIVFIQDVSERKRAEEEVLASLMEKETLLKEVHHRVKNNLQIIASLLYFQAQKIEEPASLAVFGEARDRLRSMILVHEKLYRSQDLARVDFRDYLGSLIDQLRVSYADESGKVRLRLEVGNLFLPIEVAMPVGMIVNELVTNIFKYAFPQGRGGDAGITIVQNDGVMRMVVSDNGRGISADLVEGQPTTFGLQLVGNLVKQLGGSMSVNRERGTTITIDVPLAASKEVPT